MTFRRRVVVLVAAAVATSICGASAVVYLVTRAELRARVDETLREQPARATFVEPRALESVTAQGAVKRLVRARLELLDGKGGVRLTGVERNGATLVMERRTDSGSPRPTVAEDTRGGGAATPDRSAETPGRRAETPGRSTVSGPARRADDRSASRSASSGPGSALTGLAGMATSADVQGAPAFADTDLAWEALAPAALAPLSGTPPLWPAGQGSSGPALPRVLISGNVLRMPAVAQAVTRTGLLFEPLGSTALPTSERTLAVASGAAKPFFSDAELQGVRVRVYTAQGPAGTAVSVAQPLTEVDATLRRLLLILVLVSATGVAGAAGLGVLVARRALAPVRRLTETTEHVAATQDLSRRLPETGRDELARLAASFNTMLAALDGARAAQRQLVADASHELRTPLTSVRMNVEALARSAALPAAERRRLGSSAGQLEELSVLIGDLVDLARPAPPAADREVLRLDLVVADAVARVCRRAPGVELHTSLEPCLVEAVRGALHRAVVNLLDNAVAHGAAPAGGDPGGVAAGTAQGGDFHGPASAHSDAGAAARDGGPVVEVEVRDGRLTVRDHGPGIAEEDLPHVFDRFYRARRARSRPGAGLGLAIVRQFAESHGGTVRAENAAGGGARLVLALSPTR